MDVTAEDIIGLVTLLRSSNVADIQSANNQLQELIKQPNTIPALFTLLDETEDEKIQIHAYFMLASCFRNLKSKIDDEFFLQCREQILELLQKETKTQCIEALIFVVQILNDASSPWPEIIQFAFSINYRESSKNLFLALSIFNGLIYKLSSDIILENQEGLLDLALFGLKSDFQNHQTIIQAVTFLYNLYIVFNIKTPNQILDGSVFQVRLLEIFTYSIDSSESNFFTKITKPIIIGYDEKIFIFPAVEAMPKIFQALQNDQLDAIFRLTVHNFFVNSFSNSTYSNQLNEEDWKLLFNIENYITGLIVSSADDDDANNWFDDVFNGLSIFFLKMENKEAVSFTMEQGQNLLSDIDMNEPSSLPTICFSLLMFYVCFYHYQEYFDDEQAETIYQAFIEAMNSHVQILMSLSGNCLLDLFKNFEKIINAKYISKTLLSILTYLDEVTKDDLLLYKFTKVLDNCDPIFCNLVEVCFQLINTGPSFAQYSAYFVIGECIDHSAMVAYELFDQLYEQFINIIKSQEFIQMPHHLVLMDLTALINLSPEKIEKHLDEFLVPILTAFHTTKDQLLIQNILTVLESISSNEILMKNFNPQYYELMVADFPKLIQKDWRKKIEDSSSLDIQFQKVIQKFVNAAHSLEILAKFTVEYKQFVVEGEIMDFFPAFFQALKILVDHFNELDFKSIFNALTMIIGSNSFAERGDEKHQNELLALKQQVDANPNNEDLVEQFEEKKLISELYTHEIEACKSLYQDAISLLEITNEENHASYLLIVLKFLIANKCIDEDQFETIANLTLKVIKSTNNSSLCITQLSHIIYEISKRTNFDDIYQATVPFVKELFSNEDNPKLIIDAINFIKNLDELGLIFLQKPEMIDFWQSTPSLIADPTSNKEITSAIIKMISAFCVKMPSNNNELLPYIQELISSFLESAKKRLIIELEHPSELRDNLAAFITILGGSVIGDDFPFADFMLLILSTIPLQYDFTLCSEMYQFISGIYPVVIAQNEQLKNLYIHGLVELFSQPFNNVIIMKIDPYVLNSLQKSLSKALQKEDEGENEENFDNENDDNEQLMSSVLEVLGGDQERLAMFGQTYTRIHDYYIMNTQWS